jgi:hypothetical protein
VLRCGALLLGSRNTLEVDAAKTNSAGARNSLHMRSYRASIPWQPSQTAAGSCMRRASPCHATINIKLPFRAVDDIACRRSSSPRFTATNLSHLLPRAPCAAKQQFYSMGYTDRINALFGSCFCATRLSVMHVVPPRPLSWNALATCRLAEPKTRPAAV